MLQTWKTEWDFVWRGRLYDPGSPQAARLSGDCCPDRMLFIAFYLPPLAPLIVQQREWRSEYASIIESMYFYLSYITHDQLMCRLCPRTQFMFILHAYTLVKWPFRSVWYFDKDKSVNINIAYIGNWEISETVMKYMPQHETSVEHRPKLRQSLKRNAC